jgi:hypothetical protein
MRRVRLGQKWMVRPERILSEEETVDVLVHLADPQLLMCETSFRPAPESLKYSGFN